MLEMIMADTIQMKAVRWLWKNRIPQGSLTLLAGAEGIGKSSLTYAIIAQVTKGTLDGVYKGTPKSVFIIATEDSWDCTIVPRLTAAGADLSRVCRVETETVRGTARPVSFPTDVEVFGDGIRENDVALVVLDPLMSRVDNGLDTHKDQEVRQALEPLVRMANDCGAAVLGIIHINKRNSADALNNTMGSRAFTAVARAVLYVAEDKEDSSTKYVSLQKSNLGPTDSPDLKFQIEGVDVGVYEGDDPEYAGEHILSSKLLWTGEEYRAVQRQLSYREPRTRAGDGRQERIVELVKEKPGLSKSKLYKEIGGNRGEFFEDMAEVEKAGYVMVMGFKVLPAGEEVVLDPTE